MINDARSYLLQKLDIFSKRQYSAEPSNQLLQQKYSEHFEGRIFKSIDTILLFTDILDQQKKKTSYSFSEKNYKDTCKKFLLWKGTHL